MQLWAKVVLGGVSVMLLFASLPRRLSSLPHSNPVDNAGILRLFIPPGLVEKSDGQGSEGQMTTGPPTSTRSAPTSSPLYTTTPNPDDLAVNLTAVTMSELESLPGETEEGGCWSPRGPVLTGHSSLILVPFRDRDDHLPILLRHLHPFLQRQRLRYKILVLVQNGNRAFNRAKLLNVGAKLAPELGQWDCFVFHDVDLLPLRNEIPYHCNPHHPTHLAVAMSKFNYQLPYPEFAGGAVSLTPTLMSAVNGFSNEYWGWGGEDDDLFSRLFLYRDQAALPGVRGRRGVPHAYAATLISAVNGFSNEYWGWGGEDDDLFSRLFLYREQTET